MHTRPEPAHNRIPKIGNMNSLDLPHLVIGLSVTTGKESKIS